MYMYIIYRFYICTTELEGSMIHSADEMGHLVIVYSNDNIIIMYRNGIE